MNDLFLIIILKIKRDNLYINANQKIRKYYRIKETLSENASVLLMQLVTIQRKRHSPAERILSGSSFNFPTWPTSDERYFRSLMAAGCFPGGAEIRFGNTAGSATSLSLSLYIYICIYKIEKTRASISLA